MVNSLIKSQFVVPALAFAHGVLLTAAFIMFLMSNYEDQLYDRLLQEFTQPEMSQQDIVLKLLSDTHYLLKPRQKLFAGGEFNNVRDKFLRSSDIQLIDAHGDCGSYSHVLARLLQRAGLDVRLAQMKCGTQWGCHILIEANVDGRFVSLDALYNLAFFRPDGRLASIDEIGRNWGDYKSQTPEGYPSFYAYEDVRYTNWEKIPVLMPAAKGVLALLLGGDIETLSIRSWVLNVYKAYMHIILFGYALLAIFSGYTVLVRNKP